MSDQHSFINIRRIPIPVVFITVVAVILSAIVVAPRILQTNAPPFRLHNRNFIGTWYNHGDVLTIRQDGHAHFTGRVYRWCTEGPPPCDMIEGNTIISGIQKEIVFDREQGDTLYGTITSSTDHTNGQSITVKLEANDMLDFNKEPLCGPNAPLGLCGV